MLAELVDEYKTLAWLSYTIADGLTRAGQPLADAFAVAAGNDSIIATGVNCCAPADVLAAVEIAVAASGKPAIAYPNAGETWDAEHHEWVGTSSYDLALVPCVARRRSRTPRRLLPHRPGDDPCRSRRWGEPRPGTSVQAGRRRPCRGRSSSSMPAAGRTPRRPGIGCRSAPGAPP